MSTNALAGLPQQPNSPYARAVAIAPSDTTDLTAYPRAIYVGVTGDITVTLAEDASSVLFKAVPVGVLRVNAKRVYATGTTATNLLALY